MTRTLLIAAAMLAAVPLLADDRPTEPAKTRPEMKRRIEALKNREARIPLPPLSAEELASGRRWVNNGRLRSLYLPESWTGGAFGRNTRSPGPQGNNRGTFGLTQGPDYAFKTRLFWIVSRTNDCQYCLGHQELKLRSAGMTEDQIAALDSRWSVFGEKEQPALALARKMTLTPYLVTEADVAALKAQFSDTEVVDVVQTIAGYNSTNRWTASTGIPQDKSFGGDEPSQLDTPTSAEFADVETKVAPLDYQPRPEWESRTQVEAALAASFKREPLVKLPSLDSARQVLAADTPGTTPPVWFQVLSSNPQSALRVWKQRQNVARDGKLDPRLKALIAWVCAREDRAWYAAGHARARLNALGVTDDVLYSIEAKENGFSPAEAATFAFARKLTSSPHLIVDGDVAHLRKSFSDHEVAEIIYLICDANSFDRLTETLRLPLEGGMTVAVGQK